MLRVKLKKRKLGRLPVSSFIRSSIPEKARERLPDIGPHLDTPAIMIIVFWCIRGPAPNILGICPSKTANQAASRFDSEL